MAEANCNSRFILVALAVVEIHNILAPNVGWFFVGSLLV